MAITRIKNSSIANKGPKYDNLLAGLPYRPIIGTATDGGNGTSVSVAFTGNNVAGAGVTYTALSTPGSFTGTGTASPITVSGLTAGTAYTFQVKAGNSLGDSAYSAASNSVTPVQPTAFESIASQTLTTTASSITFSSIPGTYQHLQVRILAAGASGGTPGINWQFNSDTGTNYSYHLLRGDGTSASAVGGASNNEGLGSLAGPGSSIFGTMILDIHDYASTTKNKTARAFGGADENGSGNIRLCSSVWLSTSAITSITIKTSSGSFIANSSFALYGIKA
jgi:hypothetical protein